MSEEAVERWRERLAEFAQMLELVQQTIAIRDARPLTLAEQAGLVKFFDMSIEFGWKTLALWLRAAGAEVRVPTPLNVIREAARLKIIEDGDLWSRAVERRNVLAHTYDPEAFGDLVADIGEVYLPHLIKARDTLEVSGTS